MAEGQQGYEISLDEAFTSRPIQADAPPPVPDFSSIPDIPPMAPPTGAPQPVAAAAMTTPVVMPVAVAPSAAPVVSVPPTAAPIPSSAPPTMPPPVAAPIPAGAPVPAAAPVPAPAAAHAATPTPTPASAPAAAATPEAAPMAPPSASPLDTAAATAPAFAVTNGPSELPPTADPDLLRALALVAKLGASDLHISSNTPPMVRIRGSLEPLTEFGVWSREKTAAVLRSMLAADKRAIFEETLELDWSFALTEQERFRANYYWQRSAIGAAFRIIPVEIKPIDSLGLPK